MLNSNIPPPYVLSNMANFGPLAAEISLPVWGTPANFNGFRVLALLLHQRHSKEVTETLHDVWPSLGLVFLGALICQLNFARCKIHFMSKSCICHSPVLAALLHSTRVVGVSHTLRRGTRNGITELSQRAPPIFGWPAITLGIGPHSSLQLF